MATAAAAKGVVRGKTAEAAIAGKCGAGCTVESAGARSPGQRRR